MTFSGKKILLGITGSIAAYKAVYLLRRLVENGCDVKVVMTREALNFITPLTFGVLSKHHVYVDMFDPQYAEDIPHLNLGREADAMVIAPATANIIGKMANGVCDDLLSTILIGQVGVRRSGPIIIAPAMDYEMYESPVVQKNIKLLKELMVDFVGPEAGMLASGASGQGRMSEPDDILSFIETRLSKSEDLKGQVVLVTAGPTREAIDPVRYISNSSSGKMGYAIADSAVRRGARVILISGPTFLNPPAGVECINVVTAEEMLNAVMNKLEEATIVVMAAAVSDFRSADIPDKKIKKSESITLNLKKTQDILEAISKKRDKQFIIGFAAETGDLINNATQKLKSKSLDMIVANDVSLPGAGFDVDTNIVTIIDKKGGITEYPKTSKRIIAENIWGHYLGNR
ncbi:MAG: bifunctional phosphopantothenoylcysteine decarboxylase/phosphopantothenate--cysteine ligase CoaBC [Nitrospirae bacterium]|nr:bifunctional phosphopantothenoylcysteine decarboxylase/phosphopantothenate--cysteine ligase CoaBC [Nitrospirota bacterium]